MNLKIYLSANDFDKAIADIKKYREELADKLVVLVDKLCRNGVEVAKIKVLASQGDSSETSVVYDPPNANGDIVSATIYLEGKDAIFVEFGAGIYYNNGNNHPKAAEFGFGIGTYPSKHPPNRAINPGYWWYGNREVGKHLSIGTEATMPLFNASETIRNNLIKTAIEEFMRG